MSLASALKNRKVKPTTAWSDANQSCIKPTEVPKVLATEPAPVVADSETFVPDAVAGAKEFSRGAARPRVHMHGDKPIGVERWSDRTHRIPHRESLDDTVRDDIGDLGAAPYELNWNDPRWKNTSYPARIQLWLDGGGRGPMPQEQDP